MSKAYNNDIQTIILKTDNGISALAASEKTKQVLSKFRNDNTYYSHSAFGVSQHLFVPMVKKSISMNVPLPGEKLIIKITKSLEKQKLLHIYNLLVVMN
jgi:hypothetical protein